MIQNCTVFCVKLCQVLDPVASDLVVRLIKPSRGSELGAGKVSKGVEEQPIRDPKGAKQQNYHCSMNNVPGVEIKKVHDAAMGGCQVEQSSRA